MATKTAKTAEPNGYVITTFQADRGRYWARGKKVYATAEDAIKASARVKSDRMVFVDWASPYGLGLAK